MGQGIGFIGVGEVIENFLHFLKVSGSEMTKDVGLFIRAIVYLLFMR